PRDDLSRLIQELSAQHNARGDIGREGVANTRALDGEGDGDRGAGPVPRGARTRVDREAGAHHLGIVNAPPEMAAVGHVAVLALDAVAREPARPPLVVRALEEFAVEREAVGRELVAALTELGAKEGGSARHAVVRERLARRCAGKRAVATRRAEPLVSPDVTARADQSPDPEPDVVDRIRAHAGALRHARRLLGQRGMARETGERRPGIALKHLHELSRD